MVGQDKGSIGQFNLAGILHSWLDRCVDMGAIDNLDSLCKKLIGVEEWTTRRGYGGGYNTWSYWMQARIRLAMLQDKFGDVEEWSSLLSEGAKAENNVDDMIRASQFFGEVYWRTGQLESANEKTDWAIAEARRAEQESLELRCLVQKAAIAIDTGKFDLATECLGDTWLRLLDGPLPQLLSQAYTLDAKIQIARGDLESARESAVNGFKRAWCEGPPFSFHQELEAARAMCEELEVTLPKLPEFQGETELPTINWEEPESNSDINGHWPDRITDFCEDE